VQFEAFRSQRDSPSWQQGPAKEGQRTLNWAWHFTLLPAQKSSCKQINHTNQNGAGQFITSGAVSSPMQVSMLPTKFSAWNIIPYKLDSSYWVMFLWCYVVSACEGKTMMHVGAIRHKICSHHSTHWKVHHLLQQELSTGICEGLESSTWWTWMPVSTQDEYWGVGSGKKMMISWDNTSPWWWPQAHIAWPQTLFTSL